ncbi:MAG: MFS transporter [Myxococcota bacterium]
MRRASTILALILAGECVYTLPYALRREFSPAIVETWGITQLQLGLLSSLFGVFALLCYFPGGWMADRFSARALLSFSLMATGGVGLGLLAHPGFGFLLVIYALWGVTSILTFWAALIKATRSWGGAEAQGLAFGLLDGGRGVVAAVLAYVAAETFAALGGDRPGLDGVVVLYAGMGFVAGLFVLATLPADEAGGPETGGLQQGQLKQVLRMPIVWLQAVVIFTAYAGYWGTYDIAGYAVDGHGLSQADAARLSALALWLRPIAAIGAGFIADRVGALRSIEGSFALLGLGMLSLAALSPDSLLVYAAQAAVICAAVSALRGLYYAVMEEASIPMALTGTTVGVVSVLGYTPDVLIPPTQGALLDAFPGATGHRLFFALLTMLAVVGLTATRLARRLKAAAESAVNLS